MDIIDVIREIEELDLLYLQEGRNKMNIRKIARDFAQRTVAEYELMEEGMPVLISVEELIHTDASPECDDPDCPCHAEGYAQEAQNEYDENGTHAPNCRCGWCEPSPDLEIGA